MSDETDNVVVFHGVTTLDIPPERVLNAALKDDLASVLVIGREKSGAIYIAASDNDITLANMLLDVAKRRLLLLFEDANP